MDLRLLTGDYSNPVAKPKFVGQGRPKGSGGLHETTRRRVMAVPAGHKYTAAEWAAKHGLAVNHSLTLLRKLTKDGYFTAALVNGRYVFTRTTAPVITRACDISTARRLKIWRALADVPDRFQVRDFPGSYDAARYIAQDAETLGLIRRDGKHWVKL